MALGHDRPQGLRQHAHALQRPARRRRAVAAAREPAELALLRPLPHRQRCAGAAPPDRDAYAGPGERRRGSRRRHRHDPGDRRGGRAGNGGRRCLSWRFDRCERQDGGYFEIEMRQHGLLRSLDAAELSDGTLRYLLLVAALLSPRPPPLMILNEPETSLHPDLLPPLARLIAKASRQSPDHRRLACRIAGLGIAGSRRQADRARKGAWRDGRARRGTAGVELAVALGKYAESGRIDDKARAAFQRAGHQLQRHECIAGEG